MDTSKRVGHAHPGGGHHGSNKTRMRHLGSDRTSRGKGSNNQGNANISLMEIKERTKAAMDQPYYLVGLDSSAHLS